MKIRQQRMLQVFAYSAVATLISASALAGEQPSQTSESDVPQEDLQQEQAEPSQQNYDSNQRGTAPNQNYDSQQQNSDEKANSDATQDQQSAQRDEQLNHRRSSAKQSASTQQFNEIQPADIQRVFGSDSQQIASLKGMSSQSVQELQTNLQERGLYQGEIDGIAGPQTRAALTQALNEQHRMSLRMLQAGDIPPSLMRSLDVPGGLDGVSQSNAEFGSQQPSTEVPSYRNSPTGAYPGSDNTTPDSTTPNVRPTYPNMNEPTPEEPATPSDPDEGTF